MNREQYQKKFKLHESNIQERLDLTLAGKSVTHFSQKIFPELQATQIKFKKKLKVI